MRVLELTGVVDANEGVWRGVYLEPTEGPRIGDQYVIASINKTFNDEWNTNLVGEGLRERGASHLTVLLAHGGEPDLYEGRLRALEGDKGYTTLTPGEAPMIQVFTSDGTSDLLSRLVALDGQLVTLRVDDGVDPH